MNLEYKILEINEKNRDDFFEYCKINKLYKIDVGYTSRLLNIYNKVRDIKNLMSIICYKNNEEVGICLLEKTNYLEMRKAGILHMDNRLRKNPWKKTYEWNFINLGFLSIYVKEEYRKQGIAKEFLNLFESEIKKIDKKEEDVFIVSAKEKTYKYLKNYKDIYVSEYDFKKDTSYDNVINFNTYEIIYNNIEKKQIKKNKL